MSWGIVAGAAISAGSAYFSGQSAKGASKDAQRREVEAARRAADVQGRAAGRVRGTLAPYAQQEAMGRNQLMRQLGLVGPGGGGQMMGGAGLIDTSAGSGVMRDEALDTRYIDQLQEQLVARNLRQGMGDSAALINSAQEVRDIIAQEKAAGKLPQDFYVPEQDALVGRDRWTHLGSMTAGKFGRTTTSYGEGERPTYGGATPGGVAQAGGPGGQVPRMGPGNDMLPAPGTTASGEQITSASGQPLEGEYIPGPRSGVQNVQSIMGRAGATGLPQGFEERYYSDIEQEAPQFGMGFRDNPAYQAMIEENIENVNQGAAGAGALYSGRRGEALRDVSADTQMRFYQDAADREQREYEQRMGRRAGAVGAGQTRQDQYYRDYMTMLQNLAQPTTATNLANIESGHAATLGGQMMGSATRQSDYDLTGAATESAALADIGGAVGKGIGAWMGRPRSGGGGGSAGMTPGGMEYDQLGIGL